MHSSFLLSKLVFMLYLILAQAIPCRNGVNFYGKQISSSIDNPLVAESENERNDFQAEG
jgi:hypothetical protein